jgi:hypothetical protein
MKIKLVTALTTVALFALPVADAFAGRSCGWQSNHPPAALATPCNGLQGVAKAAGLVTATLSRDR